MPLLPLFRKMVKYSLPVAILLAGCKKKDDEPVKTCLNPYLRNVALWLDIVDSKTGRSILLPPSPFTPDSVHFVDVNSVNNGTPVHPIGVPYRVRNYVSASRILLRADDLANTQVPVPQFSSIIYTKYLKIGAKDVDTLSTKAYYKIESSKYTDLTGFVIKFDISYNGKFIRSYSREVCEDSTELFGSYTNRVLKLYKRH